MNEREAISVLKRDDDSMRKGYFCINDFIAIEVAIKALEEIQQYREIGTPEELREALEQMEEEEFCCCHCDDTDEDHDCLDYMECEECPYYYADED